MIVPSAFPLRVTCKILDLGTCAVLNLFASGVLKGERTQAGLMITSESVIEFLGPRAQEVMGKKSIVWVKEGL